MSKRKQASHVVSLGWTLEEFIVDGNSYTVDMTIEILVEPKHIELESVCINKIEPRNSDEYRVAIVAEKYIQAAYDDDGDEWASIRHAVADKIARE